MKALASLLVLTVLLLPIGAALDIDPIEKEPKMEGMGGHWTPPRISERNDSPWWERSALDVDRNGISDVLDPCASGASGTLMVDLTASFGREMTENDIAKLMARGFEVVAPLPQIDAIILSQVPSSRIYELNNIEGVVFIEPLGLPVLFSDIATPSVRAKGSEMYSPETAWELGCTGKGVSIAVIDTGIDDEHPSLAGKFLAGVDMTKPDNLPFLYPQDGSYNPDDIQGHGSTCSGIATGTGAPEGIYQGTAPDARLVDIRIGTKIGYAPGEFWVGVITDPHVKDGTLRGIRWGIENLDSSWSSGGEDYRGVDIFSLSWGVDVGSDSDGSDQYSRLLDSAVEAGAIVVNAAGNDGPDNSGFTGLSASSKAIIVAATNDNDTLEHEDDIIAFYSSRGPRTDNNDGDPYDELKPDIAAPGTNINNLQPDTQRVTGDASNNGYGARGSGTSYATPLVAGVVALVLEANPLLEGRCELVKEVLRYTADRRAPPTLPDLDPFWERDHGWGTIDAYNAVRLAFEVADPDTIDTNLQAHITNISGLEDVRPFFRYNTTGTLTLGGLGWSRGGAFERTEYRVDQGEWGSVSEQSSEPFNPWKVRLRGLPEGEHRIWVRSVSGNSESLPSFIDIMVTEGEEGAGIGGEGGLFIPVVLGLLVAAGVAILLYARMRKRTVPKG